MAQPKELEEEEEMSKMLQKTLHYYLSKIRKPLQLNIRKGFKLTQTLAFAVNGDGNNYVHRQGTGGGGNNNDESATLSDVDRFLFENFGSLYIKDDQEIKEEESDDDDDYDDYEDVHCQVKSPGVIFFGSPRFINTPPNLSGSNRFFVATGFSSSLIEEARKGSATNNNSMSISEGGRLSSTSTNNVNTSSTTSVNESNNYSGGGGGGESDNIKSQSNRNEYIALLTCSVSPYDDFRRSMQEMVEARLEHGSKIDWEFVEELLFCYLNLNDKDAYKFILSAFVDLVVDLRRNNGEILARASRNLKVDVKYKRSRRTRHNSVT
ncbi:hypothetical protein V6N13_063263 [Hibiscus sabdariffa]|uniref:Uncharacterized protein n=2 Tax=Hibiscus sabdariffa TaxID=183260 RepID=A0ABR2C4L9_9ROSI